ncbi:MAG: hypothetical protein ACI4S9_00635 [Christensenellales bacterium]
MFEFTSKDVCANMSDANNFLLFHVYKWVLIAVAALFIAVAAAFAAMQNYVGAALFCAAAVAFPPILYFFQKKSVLKVLKRIKISPDNFRTVLTVKTDGSVTYEETGENYKSSSAVKLSDFHKVHYWKSKDALVMRIGKNNAILARASDMTKGNFSELIDFLSSVMKKDFVD